MPSIWNWIVNLAQKFATRTMNEKGEERTRNIAAQKKYPAPFFSPKNCVYRWNRFPGKPERSMCRRERNENSNNLSIIFFTLLFSQKKKKDTLMDHDHKCMYVCLYVSFYLQGLPRWLSGKESACQCRRWKRCRFDPWLGRIPWSRKWQPTPVFLPENFPGQRSLVDEGSRGHKEPDTTNTHSHIYLPVCLILGIGIIPTFWVASPRECL